MRNERWRTAKPKTSAKPTSREPSPPTVGNENGRGSKRGEAPVRTTWGLDSSRKAFIFALFAAMLITASTEAGPRETLIAKFAKQSKADDPSFTGFSAARGRALALARFSQGGPDTPSCTTCHTESPLKRGLTRAGKLIEPMAVSVTPDRYTDRKKVAKWFRRNCRSVLGRTCTAQEKGDFLTYMISQ